MKSEVQEQIKEGCGLCIGLGVFDASPLPGHPLLTEYLKGPSSSDGGIDNSHNRVCHILPPCFIVNTWLDYLFTVGKVASSKHLLYYDLHFSLYPPIPFTCDQCY